MKKIINKLYDKLFEFGPVIVGILYDYLLIKKFLSLNEFNNIFYIIIIIIISSLLSLMLAIILKIIIISIYIDSKK